MIPIFLATGHSGSGKSTLLRFARQAFQNYGMFPLRITDRDLLSEAVAKDMEDGFEEVEISEGKMAKVSRHAVLYKDHHEPGLRVFTVRDGVLLNRVHREMRDMVFDHGDNRGLTMEWTTGPNVESFPVLPTGEEGLYQDAESILELFGKRGLSRDRRVTIVAVNAGLSYRVERNLRRPDPMDPDDFAKIFRDGGELRGDLAGRFPDGIRFAEYDNDFDDEIRFLREMRQTCGSEISRLIEGGRANPERAEF